MRDTRRPVAYEPSDGSACFDDRRHARVIELDVLHAENAFAPVAALPARARPEYRRGSERRGTYEQTLREAVWPRVFVLDRGERAVRVLDLRARSRTREPTPRLDAM